MLAVVCLEAGISLIVWYFVPTAVNCGSRSERKHNNPPRRGMYSHEVGGDLAFAGNGHNNRDVVLQTNAMYTFQLQLVYRCLVKV